MVNGDQIVNVSFFGLGRPLLVIQFVFQNFTSSLNQTQV